MAKRKAEIRKVGMPEQIGFAREPKKKSWRFTPFEFAC
jgi:hypothetical protein